MKGYLVAGLGLWASAACGEVTEEALTVAFFQQACMQKDYRFLTNDLASPIIGATRTPELDDRLVDDGSMYGASWTISLGGTPVWLSAQVLADEDFIIGECKVVVSRRLDATKLADAYGQLMVTDGPILDEFDRGARLLAYRVEFNDVVYATYLSVAQVDGGPVTMVAAREIGAVKQN